MLTNLLEMSKQSQKRRMMKNDDDSLHQKTKNVRDLYSYHHKRKDSKNLSFCIIL